MICLDGLEGEIDKLSARLNGSEEDRFNVTAVMAIQARIRGYLKQIPDELTHCETLGNADQPWSDSKLHQNDIANARHEVQRARQSGP